MYMNIYVYIYMYIYVCIYAYMHICVCMYTYMIYNVCMYVCIIIYMTIVCMIGVEHGEFAEVAFFRVLVQQSVMEAEIEAKMAGFLHDIAGCG